MTRIDRVSFDFVDLLPQELEEGVIYISVEHCTVVHKCLSGCGERVVNGLNPAQWALTFDGETISMSPSIGNGALACNSHYWISENKVRWARPLSRNETLASRVADERVLTAHYALESPTQAVSRWTSVTRWVSSRLRRKAD